jgi:hypothetical protein
MVSPREQWDDEHIGLLAHPPPSLEELERDLANYYAWLRELTDEESRWAAALPASKREIIAAIRALPDATLSEAHLY